MSVIPVQACKLIMAPSCNVIRIFEFLSLEVFHMSKGLSLWFAVSSIVLLTASAISISYNGFLAVGLASLSILNIGWGFIIKSKRRPS